jgi:hypothetical protein
MKIIRNEPRFLPEPTPSPRAPAGLRRFAVSPTPTRSPRSAPTPAPSPSAAPSPPPSPQSDEPEDRCDLCSEALQAEHKHLVDSQSRSIACACQACALLFTRPAGWSVPTGKGGRYRTVPDRVLHDPGTPLTDAEWAELSIPVSIAFFFRNSALGRVVASYPSPAGVTECELDLEAWDRLADTHPLLAALEPDVEAILVARPETFLIPIDTCYSLAGALRLNWHGFDGGGEVRAVMAEYLGDIRRRARTLEA